MEQTGGKERDNQIRTEQEKKTGTGQEQDIKRGEIWVRGVGTHSKKASDVESGDVIIDDRKDWKTTD